MRASTTRPVGDLIAERAPAPVRAFAPGSATRSKFDRVRLRTRDGTIRELTREQFLSLPLDERLDIVLRGEPQFFRDGCSVPASEALRDAY